MCLGNRLDVPARTNSGAGENVVLVELVERAKPCLDHRPSCGSWPEKSQGTYCTRITMYKRELVLKAQIEVHFRKFG